MRGKMFPAVASMPSYVVVVPAKQALGMLTKKLKYAHDKFNS